MKKLMTMLVALACASGAWAAFSDSGENFDEKSAGAFDTSTDAKWKWTAGSDDESLTVKAWAETDTKPSSFPKGGGTADDVNYLTVETTFQNPAYRAVTGFNSDNVPTEESFDEQVYFDSLVQLTAGDQTSLENATTDNSFPGDARIAVYLAEVEKTDADPEKHLFVKAGQIDENGVISSAFYDCGTGVSEGWHRLTVRCFKDVTRTGKKIPGYVVYIDGTALKVVEGTAERFGKSADVADFVPKCATLNTNGSLFPSMEDAPQSQGIKAVGFAGTGSVDDLIFTETKPSFVTDDQNYFHLTWDEGVASLSYEVENGTSGTIDIAGGATSADIALLADQTTVIKVTVTHKSGFANGDWTISNNGIDGSSASASEGTFTIPTGYAIPSGQIVTVSNVEVAEVTAVIDGKTVTTGLSGTSLLAIVAAINKAANTGSVDDGDNPIYYEVSSVNIKLTSDATIELTTNMDDPEAPYADGVVGLGGDVGGKWTLDLNGHKITAKGLDESADDQNMAPIAVNEGTTAIITDTSADKNGSIVLDTSLEGLTKIIDNYGALTIQAGVFDGGFYMATAADDGLSADATLSISGGSFLASANGEETFSLASYVDTAKATAPEATSKIGDIDYWVVTTKGGDTPTTTYTVTFVNEKAEPTTTTQTVEANESGKYYATELMPTATGFQFEGWFLTDDQGGLADTKFDFANTEISANITLTAKWAELVTLTVAEYDEEKITSVTITNEAGTAFKSGDTFVKDDATVLTVVPVFAEGYELDTEKSTTLEITMNQNQTVTLVAKASAPTVAKIGDVEYKTLEGDNGAIAAAVAKATADGTNVTINICHDIDLTDPNTGLVIAGSGIDATKIALNVSEGVTVTLAHGSSTGIYIDDATVTFTGKGTWAKVGNSTVIRIGEKTAAANVTIDGGVFTAGSSSFEGDVADVPSNIINVKQGELTINDGTFTTEGTRCVRANNVAGKLTVNGGAFETKNASTDASAVVLYAAGGTIEIPSTSTATFKGCAANILAYMVDEITKGETDEAIYTLAKNADGAYAVTTLAAADVVATIDTASYATLEDALQAAVGKGEATVTIAKDITISEQFKLTGKGVDTTKITINTPEAYTVTLNVASHAFYIDGATVTFTGKGSWKKPDGAGCAVRIGTTSAAQVIVEDGNYEAYVWGGIDGVDYSGKPYKFWSCRTNGSITINGGTHSNYRADGLCVMVDDDGTNAKAIINGGTFKTRNDVEMGIPVGKEATAGTIEIPVTSTAKFQGYAANITGVMEDYLADAVVESTTLKADDYKFADKDSDGYYTVTKIDWVTLSITADDQVTAIYAKNNADEALELHKTGDYFDKDEATVITVTNVVCEAGYELDTANSTLTATMTENQTIVIKVKVIPTYSPVDAGSETACDKKSDATAMAEYINANKATMINTPTGAPEGFDKAAYVGLFEAKVVSVASGYAVDVVLTDDATTNLQAQVDADVKLVELTKIAAAADSTTEIETEITTTPGLYYTVYSGSETPATLAKDGDSVFATDAKMSLPFKKKGTRGFYKIGVSIKPIE